MSNKANAVLNPAGIFVDGPRLYTTKVFECRNLPVSFGNVWYVDKSVTSSGNGKTWSKAKKTITEALTLAQDYDIIRIAAGFYTEATTLTVTQVGLKIFGENSTGKTRGPVGIKTPTSAGPCITVSNNANDLEVAGIAFIATSGQKGIQLGTVASGYVWRTHIHDCSFHGDSTGTYAIGNYGASATPAGGAFPDVAECTIENNWFYAWATCAIEAYGTRVCVRNNSIIVPASAYGIIIGVGRPFGDYEDNRIFGVNSSDTGVLIYGSDEDAIIFKGNHIQNFATPITVGKHTSVYDNNYFGTKDYLYHPNSDDIRSSKSGIVWYVDAAVSASGDGKCWKAAFKTIREALAAVASDASTFQVIRVAPGDYDETAALAVAVEGTKIIGPGDDNRNVAMIYSSTGSYNLMEINAHQCEVEGLGFSVIPSTKSAIAIGTSASSYKTKISKCRFDGWSGAYGVYTDATNDCPDTVIENNLFRSCNTAGVYANATRIVIRNNIFHVVSAKIGIDYVPTGGNRPDGVIQDNVFSGVTNTTTTGIKLEGTPTNGTCIITGNKFHGSFDTAITQTASLLATENYNANNAGGALIDATT